MRRILLGLTLIACVSVTIQSLATAEEGQREKTRSVDSAAESGTPTLKLNKRTLASLNEPTLGLEVNAGVIRRGALRAELARGIGQFLRQVRTEPAFAKGRFVGWRVLELFPKRSDIRVLVLRPGDTVLRINGHSVERPEDFKVVWDSLTEAHELVVDMLRDGHPSKLHYAIAD
jgi:type II secretory pathway component PulC